MNNHVHLVVPGLFLPQDIVAQMCAGLHLPALEHILARAHVEALPAASLEDWLCAAFGVAEQSIAPVTLRADRVEPGTQYWLRADPVNLRIVHDQLLLEAALSVSEDEAACLCAALNRHFADDGLHFIAPHPQRWYLRLQEDPHIATVPLSQMGGRNVHRFMPQGPHGLRWHGILNEAQMLLHAHPVNEAREQRGEWPINGLWLWGGGHAAAAVRCAFGRVCTDSAHAAAFAAIAGAQLAPLPDGDEAECVAQCSGNEPGTVLVVWDGLHAALQHGDPAGWRESLQRFEQCCAYPLLRALRGGRIETITLDTLQEKSSARYLLTRRDSRKFWRRVRPLPSHALRVE